MISCALQGEHPLDIPCYADQLPFALCLFQPVHGKLTESRHILDDAEYRRYRAFTFGVNLFAFLPGAQASQSNKNYFMSE